jgi:hypothetical protein
MGTGSAEGVSADAVPVGEGAVAVAVAVGDGLAAASAVTGTIPSTMPATTVIASLTCAAS